MSDDRRRHGAPSGHLGTCECRGSQRASVEMAERVADAIVAKRHLIVQAGTGTGKTLAYLVPAIEAELDIVVATATKALQDQLATKDLPFLAEHLGVDFDWAVLKGRSNYVCLQRLREMSAGRSGPARTRDDGGHDQGRDQADRRVGRARPTTGDMAEMDWTPSDNAWRAVSVGSDECPGADRCPLGDPCFAEQARRRAAAADVIVVNTHLYGLERGERWRDPARTRCRRVRRGPRARRHHERHGRRRDRARPFHRAVRRRPPHPRRSRSSSVRSPRSPRALRDVLAPHVGKRLSTPLPDAVQEVLTDARLRLGSSERGARRHRHRRRGRQAAQAPRPDDDGPGHRAARHRDRGSGGVRRVRVGLARFAASRAGSARCRPDDGRGCVVAAHGDPHERHHPVVARRHVSASHPTPSTVADVGSPFDYEHALDALLRHAPAESEQRRVPRCRARRTRGTDHRCGRTNAGAVHELAIDGRGRRGPARARRPSRSSPSATSPSRRSIKAFADSAETCLFATAGLFQGVDVPGQTLSLVVIDRIPFPRPDDPLLSARREQLGPTAFAEIDIPRASMMLAQACGRLIRVGRRPRRRRGDGPAPRHRPLPLGHRQGAPPDAAHEDTAPRPRHSSATSPLASDIATGV